MDTAKHGDTTRHGQRFFFFYALALFLIVVIFFPVHALVNEPDLPPIRPILHIHAVLMGGWFGLMVLQTGLIAQGRYGLHRTFGALSIILVILMLPTGLFVSYENMIRTGHSTILIANSGNAIMFLIFYLSALAFRKNAATHKRLMLFAGVALMLPAFARVGYSFQMDEFASLPMWLGFLIAIPVFDLVTEGKIKRVTAIALTGNLLYIAGLLATLPPPSSA